MRYRSVKNLLLFLTVAAIVIATAYGEIVLDVRTVRPHAAAITVPPPEGSAEDFVFTEEETLDRLEFANNDELGGVLIGFTGEEFGLMWRNPSAVDPIPFAVKDLRRLRLARRKTKGRQATPDTVTLTNGDELRGKIVNLGAEHLSLDTWYAGRLQIKRPMVKSVLPGVSAGALTVQGLGSLAQWSLQARGRISTWEERDGSFVCSQGAPLGRMFAEMPDTARIDFTLSWHGFPSMIMSFFSDNINDYGGNCYFLNVGHNTVAVTRSSRQTGHTVVINRNMPALQPNQGTVRLSVLVDKDTSTIALLLNDILVGQHNDAMGFAGNGKGIVFQPQSNHRQRITDFRILAWDGRVPAQAAGASQDSAEDEMRFENGDRVTGKVQSMTESNVVFQTPFAKMDVPITRVACMMFYTGPDAQTAERAGDVRLLLSDGGKLTVRLVEIVDDTMKGESVNFGTVQIPLAATDAIAFNIHEIEEGREDDWFDF